MRLLATPTLSRARGNGVYRSSGLNPQLPRTTVRYEWNNDATGEHAAPHRASVVRKKVQKGVDFGADLVLFDLHA